MRLAVKEVEPGLFFVEERGRPLICCTCGVHLEANSCFWAKDDGHYCSKKCATQPEPKRKRP